jgi:hypothetical protein
MGQLAPAFGWKAWNSTRLILASAYQRCPYRTQLRQFSHVWACTWLQGVIKAHLTIFPCISSFGMLHSWPRCAFVGALIDVERLHILETRDCRDASSMFCCVEPFSVSFPSAMATEMEEPTPPCGPKGATRRRLRAIICLNIETRASSMGPKSSERGVNITQGGERFGGHADGAGILWLREDDSVHLLQAQGRCTLTISTKKHIGPIAITGKPPSIGGISLEIGTIVHVGSGRMLVYPGGTVFFELYSTSPDDPEDSTV